MKKKGMVLVICRTFFTLLLLTSMFFNTGCNAENNNDQEDGEMIQSITQYQNYFYTEQGKIYGIDEQGVKKIDVLDNEGVPANVKDFFAKGDDLFITVETVDNSDPENPITNTEFYKQTSGEITIITTLPKKPVLSRSTLNNQNFTIENYDYNGSLMSDVKNINMLSGIERFYMVDGISYIPDVGLYFNVSDGRYNETRMVRDKGLYFWPVNKPSINKLLACGEIW